MARLQIHPVGLLLVIFGLLSWVITLGGVGERDGLSKAAFLAWPLTRTTGHARLCRLIILIS